MIAEHTEANIRQLDATATNATPPIAAYTAMFITIRESPEIHPTSGRQSFTHPTITLMAIPSVSTPIARGDKRRTTAVRAVFMGCQLYRPSPNSIEEYYPANFPLTSKALFARTVRRFTKLASDLIWQKFRP